LLKKLYLLGLKLIATDVFIHISMSSSTDVINEGLLSLRIEVQIFDLLYTNFSVCALCVNVGAE